MMKTINHPGLNHAASRIGIVAATAVFLAACASVPAPTAQMAVSRAAVSNAGSAGANEYAPIQLKAAMEKMENAERAMAAENYSLAQQLAEEAQVDAQLAASMARSAKAQKAAEAVQEDSRVLRKELDRKTK